MSMLADASGRPDEPWRIGWQVVVGLIASAAAAGVLVAASETPLVAAGFAGVALVVAIAAFPALGGWIWLLLCPLIVGIARSGGPLPMRPNEALLLIAAAGIGLRGLLNVAAGERFLPKLGAADAAMALLVLTGSILPLMLRYGRDLPLTSDDVLYAFVFAKYFVLYAIIRIGVTTPRQVDISLRIALVSGAVVAFVAIMQVTGLFGVADLLHTYYDSPFEGMEGPSVLRATSTVASAFGLADSMSMCLALSIVLFFKASGNRVVLAAAAVLFLAGGVAAGSFSGFIGCAVAVLAAGYVMRRLMLQLAMFVPAAAIAALAFWPVISGRLEGFDSLAALPRSWVGRLANLQTFFWPELFSGWNWFLGVRPAARVPAFDTWRDWVYIESGHTWLLWTGGVPLVLAFLLFFWIVLRGSFRTAHVDGGPIGSAAATTFAAAAVVFVLMLFDPHLTVRGSADLFFPLLALSLVARSQDGNVLSENPASAGSL